MHHYPSKPPMLAAFLSLLVFSSDLRAFRQDELATADIAASHLDLATFPLPEGATSAGPRRLASLNYLTEAKPAAAYAWVKEKLEAEHWAELPGAYSSDDYANGTFGKQGFLVSILASPGSDAAGKPTTSVGLIQHGNLDLQTLPRPAGLEPIYAGPASAIYTTESSVDACAKACADALTEAGWIPYSDAVEPRYYKRNAVRLTVFVAAAPAQQGKTSVTYSAELMSVELDPPPEANRIHYADSTTSLHFDSSLSSEAIAAFYRKQLEPAGWTATTDNPVKDNLYETLIFRNGNGDMRTLQLSGIDGGLTRGSLIHETAAEVASLEQAMAAQTQQKAEAEEAMKRERDANVLAIPISKQATELKTGDGQIEFQLPSGKSGPAIQAIRAFLVDAGWSEEIVSDDAAARVFFYQLKDARIDLHCIDPGFIPAEVTISGSGVTLQSK